MGKRSIGWADWTQLLLCKIKTTTYFYLYHGKLLKCCLTCQHVCTNLHNPVETVEERSARGVLGRSQTQQQRLQGKAVEKLD